jgi:hypothetical protein
MKILVLLDSMRVQNIHVFWNVLPFHMISNFRRFEKLLFLLLQGQTLQGKFFGTFDTGIRIL